MCLALHTIDANSFRVLVSAIVPERVTGWMTKHMKTLYSRLDNMMMVSDGDPREAGILV